MNLNSLQELQAKTTKETPFGTIVLYWTNDDKKIKIEIQIPSNSTATFNIPKGIINYRLNGINIERLRYSMELESAGIFQVILAAFLTLYK